MAAGGLDISIDRAHHVQHNIVVGGIMIVTVNIPVGRFLVYFHVAHPKRAVDFHLCIEKIGTCMVVVKSRVDYFYGLPVGCFQLI